ncbi:MAG: hypothetical protein IMY73_04870 [Bacteroidetes bacterium]|nr:hypothetical protein [Bacteroidota bacterium]
MENLTEIEILKSKIKQLEEENKSLNKDNLLLEAIFKEVIDNISYSIAILNKDGIVLSNNTPFEKIVEYEKKALNGNLYKKLDLKDLIDEDIYEILRSMATEEIKNDTLEVFVNQERYMMNVHKLQNGEFFMITFRTILDGQLTREELVTKVQDVINRNMKMVQNISYIMGEETSSLTTILNTIIKGIK